MRAGQDKGREGKGGQGNGRQGKAGEDKGMDSGTYQPCTAYMTALSCEHRSRQYFSNVSSVCASMNIRTVR